MSDVTQTGTIVGALGLALSGILGFMGIRLHNRVDKTAEDVANLQRLMTTRDELKAELTLMRDDRHRMHEENQKLLKEIFDRQSHQYGIAEKVRRSEQDIENLAKRFDAFQRGTRGTA